VKNEEEIYKLLGMKTQRILARGLERKKEGKEEKVDLQIGGLESPTPYGIFGWTSTGLPIG